MKKIQATRRHEPRSRRSRRLPIIALVQFSVLLHTAIGILFLAPVLWYLIRLRRVRRKGKLSHYQLLGYIATTILGVCLDSGAVVTCILALAMPKLRNQSPFDGLTGQRKPLKMLT